MSIVNTLSLESNSQIKINFDGGDLFSDAGLLLIKEFVSKLGIDRLFSHSFKTNDSALFRYHTDKENLLQMIYMVIAGYFEDDASDELTNDPVFIAVLNKDALAFNFHYQSNGYHPLVCYDGTTGDLIIIQLRGGTQYSCTGVIDFLQPILDEYLADYPSINLLLRGDSGFATPELCQAMRRKWNQLCHQTKRKQQSP